MLVKEEEEEKENCHWTVLRRHACYWCSNEIRACYFCHSGEVYRYVIVALKKKKRKTFALI